MIFQIAFVIVLAVGIAFLFWVLVRTGSEKINAQYAQLAETFGLELTAPEPKMGGFLRPEPFVHGHYEGREMSISAPGKGLQNTRQSETAIKVSIGLKDLKLQMTTRGPMGGFKQRDSQAKTKWQSGVATFDAAVDARTNQSERLSKALSPELLQTVQALLKKTKGTVYAGGGVLSFVKLGLVSSEADRIQIESATRLLFQLAEALET